MQGYVCDQITDHKEKLNTSGETHNIQGSMSWTANWKLYLPVAYKPLSHK